MKKLTYLLILILGMISCNSDDENKNNKYVFIAEYSTMVGVGGIVGMVERTFKIGEIYTEIDRGDDVITIRIAKHSTLHDDCPTSWCYQELLDVPRELLELIA